MPSHPCLTDRALHHAVHYLATRIQQYISQQTCTVDCQVHMHGLLSFQHVCHHFSISQPISMQSVTFYNQLTQHGRPHGTLATYWCLHASLWHPFSITEHCVESVYWHHRQHNTVIHTLCDRYIILKQALMLGLYRDQNRIRHKHWNKHVHIAILSHCMSLWCMVMHSKWMVWLCIRSDFYYMGSFERATLL